MMAPMRIAHSLQPQALITAELELRYARSSHQVELIAKDELCRKQRIESHVLADDADEARDLWADEQRRADLSEQSAARERDRAQEAETALLELESACNLLDRELSALRVSKVCRHEACLTSRPRTLL